MTREQNESIERILNSKTFTNKEVLKGLLNYLYESTKKGDSLKEADIAVDYFKRGKDFLPGDDTIVRVNIHKLRSLLEKYYLDEGKKEQLILEIPKGSYTISFLSKDNVNRVKSPVKNNSLIIKALLASSILVNVSLFIYFKTDKKEKENPVWSGYSKNGLPVYITLGDPFFFRIKDTSSSGSLVVRDITINSEEDLKNNKLYKLRQPLNEVSEVSYPYFSKNNVWPLPDIISAFSGSKSELRLQTLSESNIEDIKKNNVVFLANINSFGFMNKFLEKTSIRLYTNPRRININMGKDSMSLTVPENIKGSYSDYAFLVKLPGMNNNIISMMGDFHASGIKGLSNYISRESTLKDLEKKIKEQHKEFPEYFEMVVKVTSYNYSDFETKLIYFKPLNEKVE